MRLRKFGWGGKGHLLLIPKAMSILIACQDYGTTRLVMVGQNSLMQRPPKCDRWGLFLATRAARILGPLNFQNGWRILNYPTINHFYFTSGGGESTDSNIKMARYYWKIKGKPDKTKVISRVWGYHGVTLAGMCATGISSYWPMFEPRIPGFSHIPSLIPIFMKRRKEPRVRVLRLRTNWRKRFLRKVQIRSPCLCGACSRGRWCDCSQEDYF
ncbi:MAG: hypothetical protein CM1200mP18_23520 [Gammaproteobacteria bacterium]|nr:MAG: hypothetical protein CM1200mP18_23520 [Gammaproteobacteria bacterium]